MKFVDADFSKVRSFEKRQELENIYHSQDPSHYERLWFVGFLKYAGYTLEEICEIIAFGAAWQDYDRNTTWCQVRSIFRPHACKEEVCISSPLQARNDGIVTRILKIDYNPWICINRIIPWKCICHNKKCDKCKYIEGSAVVL
jgi:hypothetical protein